MIGKHRPYTTSRERLPASAGVSNFPRAIHSPIKDLSVPKGRKNVRPLPVKQNTQSHHVTEKSDEIEASSVSRTEDSLQSMVDDFDKNYQHDSMHRAASRGPFSARYIEPVLPPPDTPKLYQRPIQCPETWLQNNQESDTVTNIMRRFQSLNENERSEAVASFVERNKGKMWMYDKKFLNHNEDEVKMALCNDKNIASKLAKYSITERNMKLGFSSDKYTSCVAKGGELDAPSRNDTKLLSDPYISSITTSRGEREERMRYLFAPALNQHGTVNHKGVPHTFEWGNFSRFNGHLKKNEMAMLKR